MRRHGRMRMVAFMPVRTETIFAARFAMLDLKQERRAAMPMPELGRVDLVPARHLARLQQKKDGGGMGAAMRPGLVAEGFAEPAVLGMRLQPEMRDHFVGSQRHSHGAKP